LMMIPRAVSATAIVKMKRMSESPSFHHGSRPVGRVGLSGGGGGGVGGTAVRRLRDCFLPLDFDDDLPDFRDFGEDDDINRPFGQPAQAQFIDARNKAALCCEAAP